MSKESKQYVEKFISNYSNFHKYDDYLSAMCSDYWEKVPVELSDIEDAFNDGIEFEKKKHKWHNWLEKPSVYPNFGIYVLTRFDGGNYQVCTYNSMDGCWYSQNGEINLYVDSWKEIE